jgi:DNA polymerase-3 subunit delta
MAIIKRSELQAALQDGNTVHGKQVFLLFGERFLCKNAADRLQDHIQDGQQGAVTTIDGENEDPGQTLARLMSFSLLPGIQIYRVNDSRIFHSKTVISELWDKAEESHGNGRPGPAKKNLHAMVQATGLKIDSQNSLAEIKSKEWKKLFGFEKPGGDLSWADRILFETRDSIKTGSAGLVDQYIQAFDKGIPGQNILILTA